MSFFLSKLLPLFVYPLGLACVLLIAALALWRWRRWQTGLVVLAFLALWLGGNRIVTMAVVRSLEWRYEPVEVAALAESAADRINVIVVLGGATRTPGDQRLLPEVNEAGDRLLHAAWLYQQLNQQRAAPTILLSGGSVVLNQARPEGEQDEEIIGEAVQMARLLALMGVPEEALLIEDQSWNTYENAVNTRALLVDRGFNFDEPILLVTSAMHMPRSVRIFERQGFSVIPAPTDYLVARGDWRYYTSPSFQMQLMNLLPSAADLDLTSKAIKEYIGLLVYRLRGWA